MPSLEWPEQLAALYLTHQPKLRRQLAAVVNTTPEVPRGRVHVRVDAAVHPPPR